MTTEELKAAVREKIKKASLQKDLNEMTERLIQVYERGVNDGIALMFNIINTNTENENSDPQ